MNLGYSMKFRNPCYNCLVRACCKRECIERKKFKEFFNIVMCLNIIISFLVFVIALYFIKYKYIWIGSFISNMVIYFTIHKRLPEFKNIICFFICGPFLLTFIIIALSFEKFSKDPRFKKVESIEDAVDKSL